VSEFASERYRLGRIVIPPRFTTPAPAAMVGRVVSAAASIAVGKFLLVIPVSALGSETEGGTATLTDRSAATVPVYLIGPGLPQPGDLLVCRYVDFRWVAEKSHGTRPNPCLTTWPRVLSYSGSVSQSQAGFYFVNYSPTQPEPVYTLTFRSRPADIPKTLRLEYFNQPGGVFPPYIMPMPDSAWFSDRLPVLLFGSPTYCYFYLWMISCHANVMIIDAPYGIYGTYGAITEGAGNNVHTYIVPPAGVIPPSSQFQMTEGPFPPRRIWGDHDADDVFPDAQGGAGYPGQVT
jgi:hypothetical protein